MIVELLHGARWLDTAIARKIGPAYNAVLGIGLVAEIIRRLDELARIPEAGTTRPILALALFGFLLLHQIAELSEHMDRRRKRS